MAMGTFAAERFNLHNHNHTQRYLPIVSKEQVMLDITCTATCCYSLYCYRGEMTLSHMRKLGSEACAPKQLKTGCAPLHEHPRHERCEIRFRERKVGIEEFSIWFLDPLYRVGKDLPTFELTAMLWLPFYLFYTSLSLFTISFTIAPVRETNCALLWDNAVTVSIDSFLFYFLSVGVLIIIVLSYLGDKR